MSKKKALRIFVTFALALAMAVPILTAGPGARAFMPVTGAIFTTDSTCTGVNINIFGSKDDVYLDGGPAHPSGSGLPDGSYYVQVTEPNGTQLGYTTSAAVTVAGGDFASCYQLSAILVKTSDNSAGYDTTSNPGGEYKVWVSMNLDLPEQRK